MDKKVVVFLDLLGFSNYVKDDSGAAANLLLDIQIALKTKIGDVKTNPIEKCNEEIKYLAERGAVTSFENFITSSDSILITCNVGAVDLMIKQLSRFMVEVFLINSSAYSTPHDPTNPTKAKMNIITNKGVENGIRHWYPSLFRGGISYDEFISINDLNIIEYKSEKRQNYAGKAIVFAYGLEKAKLKGPRLFLKDDIYNLCSDKSMLNKISDDLYEVLWPSMLYIENNGCSEISKIIELLIPAINFWKAFNYKDFSSHYYEFIRLIILSSMKIFEKMGCQNECKLELERILQDCGISDKIDDLFNGIL